MSRAPLDDAVQVPPLPAGQALIDSHCHLDMDEFDGDRVRVLERAAAAGVTAMVTIGAGGPLEAAYDRMKAVRFQQAQAIRSDGIRQAQIIRADADAEASSTYAEAFKAGGGVKPFWP